MTTGWSNKGVYDRLVLYWLLFIIYEFTVILSLLYSSTIYIYRVLIILDVSIIIATESIKNKEKMFHWEVKTKEYYR